MDAFSVSMANGLRDPGMKTGENFRIAGTFAFFQFLMPLTGWFCVHTILTYFTAFQKCIPWIALLLLGYIGGKMLLEGLRGGPEIETDSGEGPVLTGRELAVQGIATSIDALSVGFAISEYSTGMAFAAALIIGAVTLIICLGGLKIGRKMGTMLAGKASILGGVILIAIGLEIFISNMF
jgi:putative Mn2+ efflux pump MntP